MTAGSIANGSAYGFSDAKAGIKENTAKRGTSVH
jgi:hypothetical protein